MLIMHNASVITHTHEKFLGDTRCYVQPTDTILTLLLGWKTILGGNAVTTMPISSNCTTKFDACVKKH